MNDANTRQVGGTHYQAGSGRCPNCGHQLQHWDVVSMFNLGYLIGNATKYLFRYKDKGRPIDDLDKAAHYIQKQRELVVAERDDASKSVTENDDEQETVYTCPLCDNAGCDHCVEPKHTNRRPLS